MVIIALFFFLWLVFICSFCQIAKNSPANSGKVGLFSPCSLSCLGKKGQKPDKYFCLVFLAKRLVCKLRMAFRQQESFVLCVVDQHSNPGYEFQYILEEAIYYYFCSLCGKAIKGLNCNTIFIFFIQDCQLYSA